MGGQSRLQFWWTLSLLLVQSNSWIKICRCSLWLCELRWPFSYWTGTLLVWLSSGYRPHSSHLFPSPSISLNQRGGICSKFAKNGLQDNRNTGFHRPCYMNASLWNTWGWSWVRVSLNLSYSLRFQKSYSLPVGWSQDPLEVFQRSQKSLLWVSGSLAHADKWETLVQLLSLIH